MTSTPLNPACADALTQEEWARLQKRLTVYAIKRLGYFRIYDVHVAQDMASEALARHFDESYASWDPQREPDLLRALGSTVNGLVINWLRKHSTRFERGGVSDPEFMRAIPSQTSTAEDQLVAQQTTAAVIDQLRQRVEHDPLMRSMLELFLQGCDAPRDMAERLGVEISEIYNANRRFKTHYMAIRRAHAPQTRNS